MERTTADSIASYVDTTLAGLDESIKSLIRESFILVNNTIDGVSAGVLHVLQSQKVGRLYYAHRRSRIKAAANRLRRDISQNGLSSFALLFDFNFEPLDHSDSPSQRQLKKLKSRQYAMDSVQQDSSSSSSIRVAMRVLVRLSSSVCALISLWIPLPMFFRSKWTAFEDADLAAGGGDKSSTSALHQARKLGLTLADIILTPDAPSTGILEDLQMNMVVGTDAFFLNLRNWFNKGFMSVKQQGADSNMLHIISAFSLHMIRMTRETLISRIHGSPRKPLTSSPSRYELQQRRFLSGGRRRLGALLCLEKLDTRPIGEVIQAAGYPYQGLTAHTVDNYLLELDRIPRPDSPYVVFFQHGVVDSSFAWVANGAADSLAFRAWDMGCDVFMGNFRGNGARKHADPGITPDQYWDFSVNELAFVDLPAFTQAISEVKHKELEELGKQLSDSTSGRPFHLTTVSHSMGGAAMLMYLTRCCERKMNHHMDKVILLSPAGIHRDIPMLCTVAGPVIDRTVAKWINAFYFPSQNITKIIAKVFQDLKNLPATRDLISFLATSLLGGDVKDSPVSKVNRLIYNVLGSGTSTKIFRHFWQMYKADRFQGFDYGKDTNLAVYGTAEPPEFLSKYKYIDTPVHFVVGLGDRLIRPQDVLRHYYALQSVHPELAFLQTYNEKYGHVDFTYGPWSELSDYIINELNQAMTQAQREPPSPAAVRHLSV